VARGEKKPTASIKGKPEKERAEGGKSRGRENVQGSIGDVMGEKRVGQKRPKPLEEIIKTVHCSRNGRGEKRGDLLLKGGGGKLRTPNRAWGGSAFGGG